MHVDRQVMHGDHRGGSQPMGAPCGSVIGWALRQNQVASSCPKPARRQPVNRPIRVPSRPGTTCTCGQSSQRLRDSCVLPLVEVLGVKSRARSIPAGDAEGALDARHLDWHTSAARRREPPTPMTREPPTPMTREPPTPLTLRPPGPGPANHPAPQPDQPPSRQPTHPHPVRRRPNERTPASTQARPGFAAMTR